MQRFVVTVSDELVPEFLATVGQWVEVKPPKPTAVPRPWKCIECPQTFSTAQRLIKHEDAVH